MWIPYITGGWEAMVNYVESPRAGRSSYLAAGAARRADWLLICEAMSGRGGEAKEGFCWVTSHMYVYRYLCGYNSPRAHRRLHLIAPLMPTRSPNELGRPCLTGGLREPSPRPIGNPTYAYRYI